MTGLARNTGIYESLRLPSFRVEFPKFKVLGFVVFSISEAAAGEDGWEMQLQWVSAASVSSCC